MAPDTTNQQQQQEDTLLERRIRKRVSSVESDEKGFKRTKSSQQPRWHNQSYMLFLALRQHSEHSLPRGELIKRALELDSKISAELHLPKVFRGRTPGNSASAILTNNFDHYFIPFKPEGSRATHFKLAYEPGDTDTAVKEYQKWCKKLVEHDWPYCFGIPKVVDTVTTATTIPEQPLTVIETCTLSSDTEPITETSSVHNEPMEDISNKKTTHVNTRLKKQVMEAAPTYTLDQLDLSDIPTQWTDIVHVKPSLIPGAGNGLFAARKLPYNTPIGFYFGVPMSEDEFDSLKDRVGRSSEYSIMYRRTVLDATDDQGEPVTDQDSPRFCPFHFMNETNETGANIAFVEGVVVNQVICWTRKDIEAGEELLVWYGADVHRYWDGDKENKK